MDMVDWNRCPVGARVEATLESHTKELSAIRTTQVDMAKDVRSLLLKGAEQNGAVKGVKVSAKVMWVVLTAIAGGATFLVGWLVG